MTPFLLTAGAIGLILVAVLVRALSRRVDPTVRRYANFAAHRGWSRVTADDARDRLVAVPEYVEEGSHVQVAVGGPLGSGQGLTAVIARKDPGGRHWYVGLNETQALADAPAIDFDPRAVRTVRVVDVREVQVDEARISRGWRITAPEHEKAERWLQDGRRRTDLSDVLHRPHPWIFGVRIRPGVVTVHLARSDEQLADLDDLRRFVTLVADVAGALDVTPVSPRTDES